MAFIPSTYLSNKKNKHPPCTWQVYQCHMWRDAEPGPTLPNDKDYEAELLAGKTVKVNGLEYRVLFQ